MNRDLPIGEILLGSSKPLTGFSEEERGRSGGAGMGLTERGPQDAPPPDRTPAAPGRCGRVPHGTWAKARPHQRGQHSSPQQGAPTAEARPRRRQPRGRAEAGGGLGGRAPHRRLGGQCSAPPAKAGAQWKGGRAAAGGRARGGTPRPPAAGAGGDPPKPSEAEGRCERCGEAAPRRPDG